MTYEYVWEIQPMAEIAPHFVTTTENSVAEAARLFEESWGVMDIRYIRKKAVTLKIDYSEFESWEVS